MSEPFRYEIDLPFLPPSVLSPNNSGHWSAKYSARATVRSDAAIYARQQYGLFTGNERVLISAEIGWAGNRRTMDSDNVWGFLKPVRDGLQDWLGIDDARFDLGTVTQLRDPEKKGYVKVWLEVEENRPVEKTPLPDTDDGPKNSAKKSSRSSGRPSTRATGGKKSGS